MSRLSAIRIGHLRILDHMVLGSTNYGTGIVQTDYPMTAVPMGSWHQIHQSFCDGDLHGAFMPVPEAMSLFDSGMDIKILLFDGRSGASVIGSRLSGVNKLSDFRGKTVLISNYMSVHHLLFYRLMASAGLKAGVENDSGADVYIEIVPPFIAPEMLLYDDTGDIGGCFIEEPFGSMVIQKGAGKRLFASARLWPEHPGSVLVMHDYVIQDYRLHLLNVIGLIVATNRLIYKNSNDLKYLSSQYFCDQDREVIDLCFSSCLPESPLSLIPNIKYLEIINQFMVTDMGIMDNIINIGDLVDTSFAFEAESKKH